ncbi:MAG: hypothetical protein ABIQ52_06305 [Vicinamibacterales bacterium]
MPTPLLRETLRAGLAADRAAGCLDSETLAAWSDGRLAARERAVAESHASSCAQCQALLAAMARMTPPESPHRWWRPSTFGWLAPLAAAAVAAVLWINIPSRPLERSVAVEQAAPSPPSVSGPGAPAASPARPGAAALEDDRTDQAKKARANVLPVPPANAPPRRGTSADTQRSAAAPGTLRPGFGREESASATPKEARETPMFPPAVAPAPPLPPATAAEATVPNASPVPSSAVEPKPLPAAGAISDRAASGLRALAATKVPPGTEILSPDANVRWRILTDGRVARSTDSGATWQPQSTGVAATLTAGSAPSTTNCWLVGPGGIVVVSIDGRTWQRVSFPEAIDLTSVRASDGAHATVTAADGRTFTTTDGGKRWRSA